MSGEVLFDKAWEDSSTTKKAAPKCSEHFEARPSSDLRRESVAVPQGTAVPTSVYRYYDKSMILLYVGVTKRGAARNSEHNISKEWWRFVHRQEVEHFDTREQALRVERLTILQFRPPFNKQHNPDHEAVRALYLASGLGGAVDVKVSAVQTKLASMRGLLPLRRIDWDGRRSLWSSDFSYSVLVGLMEDGDVHLRTKCLVKGLSTVTVHKGTLLADLRGVGAERAVALSIRLHLSKGNKHEPVVTAQGLAVEVRPPTAEERQRERSLFGKGKRARRAA